MNINNSHVDEMLQKSSGHGIILDLKIRQGKKDEAFDCAWVKMPSELRNNDPTKKEDVFPPQLRKETRGIIP